MEDRILASRERAISPEFVSFLASQGARERRHSGRSLFDHLQGTWRILSSWEQPTATCSAGLFHSFYSESAFSEDVGDRGPLRTLIGEEAEALSFMFSRLDRQRFLVAVKRILAGSTSIRVANEPLTLPRTFALSHLLVANILEALRGDALTPESYQRSLNQLMTTTSELGEFLSESAVQDIHRNQAMQLT